MSQVYITERSGRIRVISAANSNSVRSISTLYPTGLLHNPGPLALDRNGRLLIIHGPPEKLNLVALAVSGASFSPIKLLSLSSMTTASTGLAVDCAHNIFFIDSTSGRLYLIPSSSAVEMISTVLVTVSSGLNPSASAPRQLVIYAIGSLFVTTTIIDGILGIFSITSRTQCDAQCDGSSCAASSYCKRICANEVTHEITCSGGPAPEFLCTCAQLGKCSARGGDAYGSHGGCFTAPCPNGVCFTCPCFAGPCTEGVHLLARPGDLSLTCPDPVTKQCAVDCSTGVSEAVLASCACIAQTQLAGGHSPTGVPAGGSLYESCCTLNPCDPFCGLNQPCTYSGPGDRSCGRNGVACPCDTLDACCGMTKPCTYLGPGDAICGSDGVTCECSYDPCCGFTDLCDTTSPCGINAQSCECLTNPWNSCCFAWNTDLYDTCCPTDSCCPGTSSTYLECCTGGLFEPCCGTERACCAAGVVERGDGRVWVVPVFGFVCPDGSCCWEGEPQCTC